MDRQIVYSGQIPLDTDLLNTNRNVMVGLAKLAAAVFGTNSLVNGLAVTPTSPASLQVNVGAGEIYYLTGIDATAYGALAADTTDQILKQGISLSTQVLNCPAPSTAGYSINYLIEAAYADTDANSVVLPYYNASNPSQAYSGPNNTGTAQNTTRKGACNVVVKAGTAALTGTQATPTPDAGYVGLAVVTVANGQTTITSGNITRYANAPILPSGGLLGGLLTGALQYADDIGAVNAYVVNRAVPAITLTDGMVVIFSTTNANTTTNPYLNVDGLGAITITQPGGTALGIGQIQANTPVICIYNSTGPRFELQNGLTLAQADARYLKLAGGNMAGGMNESYSTVASAVTPDIWTGTGNIVNYTGTVTSTGFANAPQAGARRILDCAGAAVFTAGANMLIDGLASGANLTVSAGDRVEVLARTTTQFVLRQMKADGTPVGGSQPSGGAFKNLQASATGLGANVSVTADELILETASGVAYKASAVSLTINSAGAGANGLDTGTLAASTWYSVWAIYNPSTSTVAGLISASFTAPTLPSGYTFKAIVGAIRTDGTANKYPLSFVQYGRRGQYKVASGSNVTGLPIAQSGTTGSISTPTYTAIGVSGFVPPNASKIVLVPGVFAAATTLLIAPNGSYGSYNSTTNPAPVNISGVSGEQSTLPTEMILESSSIYVANSGTTNLVAVMGWELNL